MKSLKNLVFIIIFLLLLSISIIGIVLLNGSDKDTDENLLNDIKIEKYSQ